MINLNAYFYGYTGFAVHSREFALALNAHEPVAMASYSECMDDGFITYPAVSAEMLGRARDPSSPGINLTYYWKCHQQQLGSPNVGYTVFENNHILPGDIENLATLDQVWVPSRWGKQVLLESGLPEDKIRVVPEGVNVDHFQPGLPDIPSLKTERFVFLSVGKWEVRKSTDELIRAYCRAFRPADPVELWLLADNPFVKDFDAAQALAKLNIPRSAMPVMRFLSHVPDQLMPQVYGMADVFVLPTRAEGWGLPVMEAMACGVPVIVTAYSAVTDYMSEQVGWPLGITGMMPAPGNGTGEWAVPDFDQLVWAMKDAFTHPEHCRIKGQQARDHVVASWTWDHAARVALQQLAPFRRM